MNNKKKSLNDMVILTFILLNNPPYERTLKPFSYFLILKDLLIFISVFHNTFVIFNLFYEFLRIKIYNFCNQRIIMFGMHMLKYLPCILTTS